VMYVPGFENESFEIWPLHRRQPNAISATSGSG